MSIYSEIRPDEEASRTSSAKPLLKNRYGHFDVATDEFVITDILTPRPWVNVMSNGEYGLIVSNHGGGFSWLDNSQLNRITRWEQDLVLDAYGRWFYVYDRDDSKVYSTTFAPIRERAIDEKVQHGLGYTVFRRRHKAFETTQTVFVAEGANAEHAIIEIRSLSKLPLNLVLGSYLEWFLGPQSDWHREFHRLFISTEVQGDALFAWKRASLHEGVRESPEKPMVAYAAVAGIEGVEWFTDKAQWIGSEGRLDRPAGLIGDSIPNNTGRWDDPIAAFRSPVVLEPGQSVRFGFTIGMESERGNIDLPGLEEIERRLTQTREFHRGRSHALAIKTNEPACNLMCNAWLPYQAELGRMKARCAYYQQGGAYGFRDQLQDSLMLLDSDPPATLLQLGRNAEAMYTDGGVRHWWQPNSTVHSQSRHSDTCLWLAHGVLDYLDETADFSALDTAYGYLDRESEQVETSGTLLDHCERGVKRFLERRSPRGLPLIGSGDWNDGLSHAGIGGKGESVWLAMFGFQILIRLAMVYDRMRRDKQAQTIRQEAANLIIAVEQYGWDGEWYIAGTSDDGRPFGSRECAEGQIFLNPQTWAAMTGIGSVERSQRALESVRERLIKPYGALLLSPAYREVDPYIGYITRYAPGLRENGGVYSHASTWAIQAFAQSGDSATALGVFKNMLPPLRAELDADRYQTEPYVMPGNVDGPDSPYEGRAGWTWYTGSAACMRRAALHWLIGVRSSLDGLIVDPNCVADLGPIQLRRPFRGDVFEIEIEPGERRQIQIDGEDSTFSAIAPSGQNKVRHIRVSD